MTKRSSKPFAFFVVWSEHISVLTDTVIIQNCITAIHYKYIFTVITPKPYSDTVQTVALIYADSVLIITVSVST